MATCSSILAWKIPWTEEPEGLTTIPRVTKSWTLLSDGACTHIYTCILFLTVLGHIMHSETGIDVHGLLENRGMMPGKGEREAEFLVSPVPWQSSTY